MSVNLPVSISVNIPVNISVSPPAEMSAHLSAHMHVIILVLFTAIMSILKEKRMTIQQNNDGLILLKRECMYTTVQFKLVKSNKQII